jgi:hypothetical protein
MAPPPTPGTAAPPAWTSFVPTVLLGVISAAIVLWLAPRKGCSRWLALVALIPCVGSLVIIYLFSLTDKRVLEDIETLKRQVDGIYRDTPKG